MIIQGYANYYLDITPLRPIGISHCMWVVTIHSWILLINIQQLFGCGRIEIPSPTGVGFTFMADLVSRGDGVSESRQECVYEGLPVDGDGHGLLDHYSVGPFL